MSGRGNVTLFRDGCVCTRALTSCVGREARQTVFSRGSAAIFRNSRDANGSGPDTDRTDWFVIAEAEHGYASTMPMPDDMRTVTKRPKTKKSQGSRLVS